MDLKELLGEALYKQVTEKLGDKKIDVVSDGNWIPKAKFDEVNQQKNDYKKMIDERDTQLKDLQKKSKDNEELNNLIEQLRETNKKTATDYETKLKQQAKTFAIERAISTAKGKNPKAIQALLDIEKVVLDGDKLIGLDEQLTALKTSDGYLFDAETGGGGVNPAGGGGNDGKADMNAAIRSAAGYK